MGYIAVMIFCGLIGIVIGKRKGMGLIKSFIGGAILGPLCFLMIFLSKEAIDCPKCAEKIKPKAKKCIHCGYELAASTK